MLSLKYSFDDTVDIDGVMYTVNASFDVIMRVLDMMKDEKLTAEESVNLGLVILLGSDEDVRSYLQDPENLVFMSELSFEKRLELLVEIMREYVGSEQEEQYDLAGNPMPVVNDDVDVTLLDFDHDAESIYASFMQAYRIDLIDEQGKLHWSKFVALLNGLPEDSQIRRIISLRAWKPSDEKKPYKSRMLEAQKQVQIPEEY